MIPPQMPNRNPLDDSLRVLEQAGFQFPGPTRVRDVEDDVRADLEAIQNSSAYVTKVQHLRDLYSYIRSYASHDPRFKEDKALQRVVERILAAEANPVLSAPTFSTRVIPGPDPIIAISIARSQSPESFVPAIPEIIASIMSELKENAHWRIYDQLVKMKGDVVWAAERVGLISRAADRTPAKVNLDLEPPKTAEPEGP